MVDCTDFVTATPQEKAIIMCIERIERLEDRVNDLEAECKQHFIRDILTLTSKEYLMFDIFAFLCGVPIETRQNLSVNEFIFTYFHTHVKNIPQRACDLFAFLHGSKEPWNTTMEDKTEKALSLFAPFKEEYGVNIHAMLQAMTYEELKGYWTYRLEWTRCINTVTGI